MKWKFLYKQFFMICLKQTLILWENFFCMSGRKEWKSLLTKWKRHVEALEIGHDDLKLKRRRRKGQLNIKRERVVSRPRLLIADDEFFLFNLFNTDAVVSEVVFHLLLILLIVKFSLSFRSSSSTFQLVSIMSHEHHFVNHTKSYSNPSSMSTKERWRRNENKKIVLNVKK